MSKMIANISKTVSEKTSKDTTVNISNFIKVNENKVNEFFEEIKKIAFIIIDKEKFAANFDENEDSKFKSDYSQKLIKRLKEIIDDKKNEKDINEIIDVIDHAKKELITKTNRIHPDNELSAFAFISKFIDIFMCRKLPQCEISENSTINSSKKLNYSIKYNVAKLLMKVIFLDEKLSQKSKELNSEYEIYKNLQFNYFRKESENSTKIISFRKYLDDQNQTEEKLEVVNFVKFANSKKNQLTKFFQNVRYKLSLTLKDIELDKWIDKYSSYLSSDANNLLENQNAILKKFDKDLLKEGNDIVSDMINKAESDLFEEKVIIDTDNLLSFQQIIFEFISKLIKDICNIYSYGNKYSVSCSDVFNKTNEAKTELIDITKAIIHIVYVLINSPITQEAKDLNLEYINFKQNKIPNEKTLQGDEKIQDLDKTKSDTTKIVKENEEKLNKESKTGELDSNEIDITKTNTNQVETEQFTDDLINDLVGSNIECSEELIP